jgi:hypothetical protein
MSMSTRTITIKRTPSTLNFGGKKIEATGANIEFPFTCKLYNLNEVNHYSNHKILQKKPTG